MKTLMALTGALVLMLTGCDGGATSCTTGATQGCLCGGGAMGVQTCLADGTWGMCSSCSGGGDGGEASCPDPAGCPTGCCAGAVCMPGDTVSACGSGGGSCSTCGDGESCSGGACETPRCSVRNTGSAIEDTCTGENICSCAGGDVFCEGTGTCVPAFGRIYRIGVSQVTLPERDPAGECWDVGCGAPDPYVTVSVDGSTIGATPAGADVFSVTWDPIQIFEATVLAGTDIRFDVWDEDATSDDGAFFCADEPITVERLRGRNLSCGGEIGSLTAVIVFVP